MNTEQEEKEVKKVFLKILSEPHKPALNYAVEYAKAGLTLTGEALKIQVLYVLNNIPYWRGKGVKEARAILKRYATKRRI